MAKHEERMQILEMLKDGKITTDDAAKLLEALDADERRGRTETRSIHIRVFENGKDKVNVNIPVSLAKLALNLVPKDVVHDQNLDLRSLITSIEAGFRGKLVEADIPEEGRKIEVFVE